VSILAERKNSLEEEIIMSLKISFPKKELNKWLKTHKTWDHDDWLKLLDELKNKGFGNLVGDQSRFGWVVSGDQRRQVRLAPIRKTWSMGAA
jgi:hypothetical protein